MPYFFQNCFLDADLIFKAYHYSMTTILAIRKDNEIVIAGDGQVSLGQTIMKGNARKVRRLGKEGIEALMAVCDKEHSFILSGTGDVVEPEDGIIGIGSGGNYALAAARALYDQDLSAEEIAKKSLKIAADICVYTNDNIIIEKL